MKKLTIQEKKDIPFGVKADSVSSKAETTGRTVDFIANTYNYFDTDSDVLVPGCCAKSIKDRGPQSNLPGKIKHLSNHDLRNGIGVFSLLEESKYNGLDVLRAASELLETSEGEDKLIKYIKGAIDQHSIGFRYLDLQFLEAESEEFDNVVKNLINPEEAIDRGYLFLVNEIQLMEISSLDGFGANRLTDTIGIKSENKNVQFNNLMVKLNSLTNALRTGGDKEIIKMEELQVKQMIYELYNPEPSGKPTPLEPGKNDTLDMAKEINKYSFNIN